MDAAGILLQEPVGNPSVVYGGWGGKTLSSAIFHMILRILSPDEGVRGTRETL
jgi:ABC-type phosphate transport system permease subunit